MVRRRQGFRRQLSADAIVCVALAHTLVDELSVSAEAAVALAHELMSSPSGSLSRGLGGVMVSCDLATLRQRIRAALDVAVAHATDVPRGRPRSRAVRRRIA
jgi:hypothetical protein